MTVQSIDQLDVAGKRVLVRVDFNVPLADGSIVDPTRISASIPTITRLLDQDAIVILASHLGRPGGETVSELSLRPVSEKLQELLNIPVIFATDTVGSSAQAAVNEASPGDVILLENVRFQPGEQRNDPEFAQQLAGLADCYVNDAFGTAHRAHASTVGVPRYLPSAAGLLMLGEIFALRQVLEYPQLPLTLVLGGAKVSEKIGVIRSFLQKARSILIGGGMANTFILASGIDTGRSLAEPDLLTLAREIVSEAIETGVELIIPCDVVVAKSLTSRESRTIEPGDINPDEAIFDIGPKTVELYSEKLETSSTIIWNGPMGVFETKPYDAGTIGIAHAVANSKAFSLVGGGDSVSALNQVGLASAVGHVSTGGGASLEYLEGKSLPGILALEGTGQ